MNVNDKCNKKNQLLLLGVFCALVSFIVTPNIVNHYNYNYSTTLNSVASIPHIKPFAYTNNASIGKVYYLTMIEIMNNPMGSAMQPIFFIVTQNGLTPAVNISLPAHTLIILTVTSYDNPTPGTPIVYSNVTGTIGNIVTMINASSATGSTPSTGSSNTSMAQNWEMNVSFIQPSLISHTFTVSQLKLNIPIEGGFTEIAKFYVNSTGAYMWQCMSPCGTGASGWGGAMSTSGWMTGTFYVYTPTQPTGTSSTTSSISSTSFLLGSMIFAVMVTGIVVAVIISKNPKNKK
jgi:hypothetical protein